MNWLECLFPVWLRLSLNRLGEGVSSTDEDGRWLSRVAAEVATIRNRSNHTRTELAEKVQG